MTILARFEKQPTEVKDYDVSFVKRLTQFLDTASSHSVVAETGISVDTSILSGGVIKIWTSGGVHLQNYKITVFLNTLGGRTWEEEIVVKVRER